MPATKKAPAPRKPKVVPEPKVELFDLDAAISEVTEPVELVPFEFNFGGESWSMRPVADSNAKLMANLDLSEVQQIMSYIRDLLGEEQWVRFPRLSYTAAMILIEQYAEYSTGDSLGESEAPTDS